MTRTEPFCWRDESFTSARGLITSRTLMIVSLKSSTCCTDCKPNASCKSLRCSPNKEKLTCQVRINLPLSITNECDYIMKNHNTLRSLYHSHRNMAYLHVCDNSSLALRSQASVFFLTPLSRAALFLPFHERYPRRLAQKVEQPG